MQTIEKTEMIAKNMNQLRNPSKTVINCVKTVLESMAYEQCIREKVEPIQKEMLLMCKCIDKRTGEQITEPKHSYLMSDEQFDDYIEECQHDYKNVGFADKKYHGKEAICPLLEAESMLRDSKRALVYALEDITGITYDDICYKLEYYNRYIDLNLKYLTQFIK